MSPDDLALEARAALPLGVHAVAEARAFARQRLGTWEVGADAVAAVTLVVSELVTNAVLYGHGAATLLLRLSDDEVLVEVADRSPVPPQARHPHDESEIGRGLHIIEACSVAWGVRPEGDGKVVWSRLAATEVAPVARELARSKGYATD